MLTNCCIAAGIVGLALGIASGQPASAQVKVGSVLSITGPASFLGDPEKKTLDMYVDEINAKGGVNGQKLELIGYDDGGDANNARTFATRLVEEDKVVAMVGGTTTGSTLSMIPVFEDAQIPFISLADLPTGPPRTDEGLTGLDSKSAGEPRNQAIVSPTWQPHPRTRGFAAK